MRYKRIRSLERGVAVLQFLNRAGVATAGEIARHIELPRPTVYRILDTLVECGLLYRSPSSHKVYRLTEAVELLSPGAERLDHTVAAVRSVLGEAQASLPWPVFFSSPSDEGIVIRETTRGSSIFWTELGWIGSAAPVWEVAAGRVLAAFAGAKEQTELLASAPDGIDEEMAGIRSRGYAEDRSPGGDLVGIAVPVGESSSLIGSLAMFWGPIQDQERELIANFLPTLLDLGRQILSRVDALP